MQVSPSSDMGGEIPVAAVDPQADQLRMLTAISRALTYTTSLGQVARLTVDRGVELLDAAAAILTVSDADGMHLIRATNGVTDQVLAHDPRLGDDPMPELQRRLGGCADRNIAVPLVVGGEVIGLLAVAMRRPVTTADEWLLSALADQAAVSLESARLGGEVRLEMERRLRASEGATNSKDRALATLAHDIRTPLGAIEGYCGILDAGMQGPINDEQRETLGRVRMAGRHLMSLLDNVMDMARLDAGVVNVAAVPVRLAEVAGEAVQLLGPAAHARLQELALDFADDVVVIGDHDRLRQVLVNLVGNAVKFTPDGGTISITTTALTINGRSFGEVRVADTGPGIPAADLAAIFEPYYRSEGTAHAPGVGLGLAISNGLVRQMCGELLIDSEPGAGATFTLRLPTRQPAAP